MGCTNSKQFKCRHCNTPYSPMMTRRSFSMNVHHPPVKEGDTYHVVALTSSTLGSIKLDPPTDQYYERKDCDAFEIEGNVDKIENCEVVVGNIKDFELGMIEAKAWSKMIDEKINRVVPKTPIRTPPGEPETINVHELMEGLDDSSPLRLGPHCNRHLRSFSFHVSADSIPPLVDSPRTDGFQQTVKESAENTKAWFDEVEKDDTFGNENSISKGLVSEFDPEVITAFRKALEQLSPTNPFHLKPRDGVGDQQQVIKEVVIQVSTDKLSLDEKKNNGMLNGFVAVNGFVDRIIAEEKDDSLSLPDNEHAQTNDEESDDARSVSSSKEKVILYFTSLRGVRQTFENCCYVRLILKGLGVRVDERDVSMHSGFKEELKELLGGNGNNGGLPKVFVGERYIGGIDEIRKLHEDGELEKVVQHCERLDDYGCNLCEACGDIRFVPCETCSGSCKIYYEHDEDEEEEEDEYGFKRCPDCNENGLIRCPVCCY